MGKFSPEQTFRRKMFQGTSYACAAMLTIGVVSRHISSPLSTTNLIFNFVVVGIFLLCGYGASRRNFPLAVLLTAFLGGVTFVIERGFYSHGGFFAPIVALVVVFPVLGFCFGGHRYGWFSLSWAIVLILFGYLDHEATSLAFIPTPYERTKAIVLIAMSVLSALLGVAFNQARLLGSLRLVETSRLASLGTMAGGVAHEIKNPLAIIQGLATQLINKKKRNDLTDDVLLDRLGKIINSVQRISEIVSALQTYSQDDSQKEKRLIDIAKTVDEVLTIFKEKLTAGGVEFQQKNELSPQAFVLGQSTQLSQAILNILINAFDAIQSQERKWIALLLKSDSDHIAIEVSDSGPGISSYDRQKIFAPFFTTKEVGKGVGLGLSVAMSIVQQHGGSIEVSSGSPTTFVIRLPLAKEKKLSKSA